VLKEWIDVNLLLSLWELQGSILNLCMKFSSKAPTICCGVFNTSVKVAVFWDFFFPLWLLPSRASGSLITLICHPLIKDSNHFFFCAWYRSWWLSKFLLGRPPSFAVSSRYSQDLWWIFLFSSLLNMRLD
jgi:hypothetical protein